MTATHSGSEDELPRDHEPMTDDEALTELCPLCLKIRVSLYAQFFHLTVTTVKTDMAWSEELYRYCDDGVCMIITWLSSTEDEIFNSLNDVLTMLLAATKEKDINRILDGVPDPKHRSLMRLGCYLFWMTKIQHEVLEKDGSVTRANYMRGAWKKTDDAISGFLKAWATSSNAYISSPPEHEAAQPQLSPADEQRLFDQQLEQWEHEQAAIAQAGGRADRITRAMLVRAIDKLNDGYNN